MSHNGVQMTRVDRAAQKRAIWDRPACDGLPENAPLPRPVQKIPNVPLKGLFVPDRGVWSPSNRLGGEISSSPESSSWESFGSVLVSELDAPSDPESDSSDFVSLLRLVLLRLKGGSCRLDTPPVTLSMDKG